MKDMKRFLEFFFKKTEVLGVVSKECDFRPMCIQNGFRWPGSSEPMHACVSASTAFRPRPSSPKPSAQSQWQRSKVLLFCPLREHGPGPHAFPPHRASNCSTRHEAGPGRGVTRTRRPHRVLAPPAYSPPVRSGRPGPDARHPTVWRRVVVAA